MIVAGIRNSMGKTTEDMKTSSNRLSHLIVTFIKPQSLQLFCGHNGRIGRTMAEGGWPDLLQAIGLQFHLITPHISLFSTVVGLCLAICGGHLLTVLNVDNMVLYFLA